MTYGSAPDEDHSGPTRGRVRRQGSANRPATATARGRKPGLRVDPGLPQGRGPIQIRQETGEARRQHGLSRSGWTDEQHHGVLTSQPPRGDAGPCADPVSVPCRHPLRPHSTASKSTQSRCWPANSSTTGLGTGTSGVSDADRLSEVVRRPEHGRYAGILGRASSVTMTRLQNPRPVADRR